MSTKKWFAVMAITAGLSVVSFFQINSYWADKNKFNGGWTVIGIVLGLAAVVALYKVIKQGGTSNQQ